MTVHKSKAKEFDAVVIFDDATPAAIIARLNEVQVNALKTGDLTRTSAEQTPT